jgi:UDP:flavonoid glycosyltransferase YjiC (YdhE family)
LAVAIRAITEDGRMRRRAAEVGEGIRAEDGVARAVEIVAGRTSEGTPYKRSSGDEPSRRLGE